jgi:Calcineurin-like phosphoesterase
MDAQLHSTRLFNENYFAFIATLDDIVKKGIRYVVIAGDLTDDGQEVHTQSVRSILDKYKQEHRLSFFITSGNHDVITPFAGEYQSRDFLSEEGNTLYLTSAAGKGTDTLSATCMKTIGYTEMKRVFADYGFIPQKQYLYWGNPFTDYDYQAYTYDKAAKQAEATIENGTDNAVFPSDLSYLVEPVEGLWLLAIDANVMVAGNDGSYKNRGGYNDALNYKKYLLPWIKKVAEKARQQNKLLICFSHYPMVDYTNGSFAYLRDCNRKMNFSRIPRAEVSQLLADAGIYLHFGGHMHINNTGFVETPAGNKLYNIQVPSLAAYLPGYKILTVESGKKVNIRTAHMDNVSGFDQLFPIYENELKRLQVCQPGNVWKRDILDSKDYREFTRRHLEELLRMRFIPSEYPAFVKDTFAVQTGKEALLQLGYPETALPTKPLKSTDTWTGFDYILDFYRILNGGKQAITEIGEGRMNEYNTFNTLLMQNKVETEYGLFLKHFARAFNTLQNGLPTDKVDIQLE